MSTTNTPLNELKTSVLQDSNESTEGIMYILLLLAEKALEAKIKTSIIHFGIPELKFQPVSCAEVYWSDY